MNATEYLAESARTCNADQQLLHGVLGITSEAGEVADYLKRIVFYKKAEDRTKLLLELGDILWYIALVLRVSGSTFEEAFDKNIAKLKARYPDKFTTEAALNRDLVKEGEAVK